MCHPPNNFNFSHTSYILHTTNEKLVFASIYISTLLYRITGHTKYLISLNILRRYGHVPNANIPFFPPFVQARPTPFIPFSQRVHLENTVQYSIVTGVYIHYTVFLFVVSHSLSLKHSSPLVQIFDNGFPFWLRSDILK